MTPEDVELLGKMAKDSGEKIEKSSVFLSLFSEGYAKEPLTVLQMGLAILLDKPILVMAPVGVKIPANLLKVATGIRFYNPEAQEDLQTSLEEILRDLKW